MRAIVLLAPFRSTLGRRAPFGNAALAGTCFVESAERSDTHQHPNVRPASRASGPRPTPGEAHLKSGCDPFAACNPKKYGGQISTEECQIFSGRFGGGLN